MTLYFVFYFGSLAVGPIIAGAMAQHVGWRNFWWLNVAMHAAIIIALVFLFPETRWHRLHPREMLRRASVANSTTNHNEKGMLSSHSGEHSEKISNGDAIAHNTADTTMPDSNPANLEPVLTADRDPYLHKGKPSKSQFKLFAPNAHPLKSIALDLWIPVKLFAFPIVEFSAFVVSWSASSFLTLNLTQSQNFAAPPYNFGAQSIGFMNFAILAGQGIGLITNGWLSDWFAARLTSRNRGVREPEMRLPTMIPFVLIMLLGNFIVAFGYQYKWPWEVIVIIGFTCAGIQVAALPAIATTYGIDSYKPVAGSIMVTITVNKNVWGYGFSKFITPWIVESGYVQPIMLNMCLIFLWCSFGVLFYFFGKRFRGMTKNSNIHDL